MGFQRISQWAIPVFLAVGSLGNPLLRNDDRIARQESTSVLSTGSVSVIPTSVATSIFPEAAATLPTRVCSPRICGSVCGAPEKRGLAALVERAVPRETEPERCNWAGTYIKEDEELEDEDEEC